MMLKTAVITDEISQDFEEAAGVAKQFGLDAVELRTLWDKAAHELTEADVARVKAICAENALGVCAISSPFYKCGLNDEEIAVHQAILEKTIQVARALNCRIIRGFTFWTEQDFEPMRRQIAAAFVRPAQMMREAGMILALEPDPSVYASNGQMLARLLKEIDHPCVRALWDAGNDVYSPVPERPFPDGYEQVKPYIAHVHLKDAVQKNGAAESVKIGTGEVNWPAHLTALLADGYEGYVSLETHYRKGARLSESLLRMPGGGSFSQDGREASEECLEALREMLAEIRKNQREALRCKVQ